MIGPLASTIKRSKDVTFFSPSTPTKKGKTLENHFGITTIEDTSPGSIITQYLSPIGDSQLVWLKVEEL